MGSGLLRLWVIDSSGSRRIPTFRLKNGSWSIAVENLNRLQETKKESFKEAASSRIMIFNHCHSTEIDQEPQKPSNLHAIYHQRKAQVGYQWTYQMTWQYVVEVPGPVEQVYQ